MNLLVFSDSLDASKQPVAGGEDLGDAVGGLDRAVVVEVDEALEEVGIE